jgi:uncharacterized RDD family membrane protein YckC
MEMDCPYCGAENEDGRVLCKSCGKVLNLDAAVAEVEQESRKQERTVYPIEEKMKEKGVPPATTGGDWREELRRRVEEIKKKREFEKTLGPEWQDSKAKRSKEEASKVVSSKQDDIGTRVTVEKEVIRKEEQPSLSPLAPPGKGFEEEEKLLETIKEGEPDKTISPSSTTTTSSFLDTSITQEIKPRRRPGGFKPLDDYQPIAEVTKKGVGRPLISSPISEELASADRDLVIRGKVIASIIDFVISSFLFAGAFYGVMRLTSIPPLELLTKLAIPLSGLYLLISMVYSVFFISASGQTIGRMIANIRVISEDYDRVGFFRAFLRWFGGLLAAIPLLLGYISVLSDQEARGIPDKLAGTRVELV